MQILSKMHCFHFALVIILGYAATSILTLQLLNQNDFSLLDIRNRAKKLMSNFYAGMLDNNTMEYIPSESRPGTEIVDISSKQNFLRVCYYSSGDPEPSEINGTLCTHIIKGFASVENGTLSPGTSDVNNWLQTTKLKQKFVNLKVMLSVGGGGFNDKIFSHVVNTKENRTRFIQSCLETLSKYDFDGLDIDWEFPVWNDFEKDDKENFVLLLKEFKMAAPNSLLSIAVAAPKTIIDQSYDVPAIAKYVDFINLMSYDYHDYTFYTPFTGHNSPLFKRFVEHAYFATLNTNWSALYWVQKGMPKEKIMVGLPTYGHTYTLLDPKLHNFDSPAVGYGTGQGTTTYYEVCTFLKNGALRIFDNESQVPFAFMGYEWRGYDDYQSIHAKATWVKTTKFGGVMTFDLNCDDWQGICDGKTKFPLHKIIYDILTGS